MTPKTISKKLIHLLNPKILDRNGRFLYSGANTLRRGKIYLLGHNPGGEPEKFKGKDVRFDVENLSRQTSCAYLDEEWGGKKPGENKLQKRVIWLIKQLGFDIKKVCASNLIFARSGSVAKLHNFRKLADLCWPAHEFILHIVQPKLLIVFGNSPISPFNYLERKAKNKIATQTHPSRHGNWRCRLFHGELANLKVTVIGLPHLSRFNVIGKDHLVKWIRKYL
jgi:hypothetical protein